MQKMLRMRDTREQREIEKVKNIATVLQIGTIPKQSAVHVEWPAILLYGNVVPGNNDVDITHWRTVDSYEEIGQCDDPWWSVRVHMPLPEAAQPMRLFDGKVTLRLINNTLWFIMGARKLEYFKFTACETPEKMEAWLRGVVRDRISLYQREYARLMSTPGIVSIGHVGGSNIHVGNAQSHEVTVSGDMVELVYGSYITRIDNERNKE